MSVVSVLRNLMILKLGDNIEAFSYERSRGDPLEKEGYTVTIWDPKQTLDSIGIGGKSEKKRSSRVAEAIRNELAILLLSKVRDPRLQGVSISRVEVPDDLSTARIFFTVLGGKKEIKEAGSA